jgi:hypothetical protein
LALAIDAEFTDHGQWTEERCKRCLQRRAAGLIARGDPIRLYHDAM